MESVSLSEISRQRDEEIRKALHIDPIEPDSRRGSHFVADDMRSHPSPKSSNNNNNTRHKKESSKTSSKKRSDRNL